MAADGALLGSGPVAIALCVADSEPKGANFVGGDLELQCAVVQVGRLLVAFQQVALECLLDRSRDWLHIGYTVDESRRCERKKEAPQVFAGLEFREAEGTGLEPATPFGAPHFQSTRDSITGATPGAKPSFPRET